MKEIKAWKTDDEKVFENEEDASNWQSYLNLRKELSILIKESDIISVYDNTDDHIIRFIIQNEKKLKDLFDIYGIINIENIEGI